jgi:thioesterase-3
MIRSSILYVSVRPTDLDINSHVNNARYIEYLQWGRWNWFAERGFSNEKLRELRAIPIVVNIDISFKKEILYNEVVTVTTVPESISQSEKSFVLRQQINKFDGVLAAEATVTMVAFDPTERKSRVLPDELKAILED